MGAGNGGKEHVETKKSEEGTCSMARGGVGPPLPRSKSMLLQLQPAPRSWRTSLVGRSSKQDVVIKSPMDFLYVVA